MYINAKDELLKHISNKPCVKYIKLRYNISYDEDIYFEGTPQEILLKIKFNYDNGYGGQTLFGLIWYEDGTWSERGEYDGSEWWEYKKCPTIEEKV
jgi:hypothetical protein